MKKLTKHNYIFITAGHGDTIRNIFNSYVTDGMWDDSVKYNIPSSIMDKVRYYMSKKLERYEVSIRGDYSLYNNFQCRCIIEYGKSEFITISGFGKSPELALKHCKENIKALITLYSK